MRNYILKLSLCICFIINCAVAKPVCESSEKIKIVSSLPAIHSVVLNLTKDTDIDASLLLSGNISPHDYQLKPSDVQSISNADIIIAISPEMETFIKAPYKNKPKCQNWIMLENHVDLLRTRNVGEWTHDDHGKDKHSHNEHKHDTHRGHSDHGHDGHHDHNHSNSSKDFHIWLSPEIMMQSAKIIKDTLIASDKKNENIYNRNYQDLITKLSAKSKEIANIFHNKKINFIVFHDAFQYFEKEYKLKAVGSMTGSLSTSSAKQRKRLLDKVKKENVSCIVFETQTGRAEKLAKQLGIKPVAIDLLGTKINKDREFYLNYIDSISNSFFSCIKN